MGVFKFIPKAMFIPKVMFTPMKGNKFAYVMADISIVC